MLNEVAGNNQSVALWRIHQAYERPLCDLHHRASQMFKRRAWNSSRNPRQNNLLGPLVTSEAEKDGLAEFSIRCPFLK